MAPFPAPYTHLEPLRVHAELQLRVAYGPYPTLPGLTAGTPFAASLRQAFERATAIGCDCHATR
jgi:hypothetical protein